MNTPEELISSGKSFFMYRSPGTSYYICGSSNHVVKDLRLSGFVVGMFLPGMPIITIPFEDKEISNQETSYPDEKIFNFPESSTSFSSYSTEVNEIVNAIKAGKGNKVVAARVIIRKEPLNLKDKFHLLCEKYPRAYIFCFYTPITGCWIGASPELLLESKSGILSSMALAGTRKTTSHRNENEKKKLEWDSKNIEEQHIVSEYIVKTFLKYRLNPEISETFTKQSGNIEHICNNIKAGNSLNKSDFQSFLSSLSPTPALCGYPKEFALEMIKKYENFDRGCYGGFCGPYHNIGDFCFNVILRCMAIEKERQVIFVGGGITSHSVVETEWLETELKAQSIF